MNHAPTTANATYAAELCDQLSADGMQAAFIAPGSRSTPLALALVEHADIDVHVFHDERAAAFAALGHALETGRPAVVLCSSGTAGAHFYAAVIEADVAAVPLIAVTADRPPELWGRGAPQTIDQTHLYGTRVRAFFEPGPPDDPDPADPRTLARSLWQAATRGLPGPVHLNQSFRDPLTGTAAELTTRLSVPQPDESQAPDGAEVERIAELLGAERGVIVAGRGESDPEQVLQLAERLGWPVVADHRSGCRSPESANVIARFDSLLRSQDFARDHRPDVVLRLGEIVSSKAVSQWLAASAAAGATVVSGRPQGRAIDPEAIATRQFDEAGVVSALVDTVDPRTESPWLDGWRAADVVAEQTLQHVLADASNPNEVAVARAVVEGVPNGGALVVASSMPVRDVEWFGPNRDDIAVYANRGANGIDGTIATAIGIAATGRPTVCLIGDVALLHDSTSLVALASRDVDLTIVVTDNDGGAIFSFLPQHRLLDATEYEPLFGTPHGTDLTALAAAHGLAIRPFDGEIDHPAGVTMVVATTDRTTNLALHDEIHARIAAALRA